MGKTKASEFRFSSFRSSVHRSFHFLSVTHFTFRLLTFYFHSTVQVKIENGSLTVNARFFFSFPPNYSAVQLQLMFLHWLTMGLHYWCRQGAFWGLETCSASFAHKHDPLLLFPLTRFVVIRMFTKLPFLLLNILFYNFSQCPLESCPPRDASDEPTWKG